MPSERPEHEAATKKKAKPTGRSARFYEPLKNEVDVEAIAQRVAQHCAVALQRDEADAIQVTIQEAKSDE